MKKKLRYLSILDDFECIGSDCSSSCCSFPWSILVDADTLDKWKKIEENDISNKLILSMEQDELGRLKLKHTKNNSCVHENINGLCDIQTKFGHDYLPGVCRSYPRKYAHTEFQKSASLRLSCPEVLKLVMAANRKKLYLEKESSEIPDSQTASVLTHEMAIALNKFVEKVLNSNSPVNIIIYHIARELGKLAQMSEEGMLDIEYIDKLSIGVNKHLQELRKLVSAEKNQVSLQEVGQFWRVIFSSNPGLAKLFDPEQTINNTGLLVLLLQENCDDNYYQLLAKKTIAVRKNFYRTTPPFYVEFMRKYLIIKFQNNLFPMDPVEGNVIAEFLNCIIPYALIQLLCWERHYATGVLNADDAIRIVYETERKSDHNMNIYKHLADNPALLRIDTYFKCFSEI